MERAATRAVRSTAGFVADRIASSEWMTSVVYDLINGHNFAGLEEHEEMLSDSVRVGAYHRGIHRNVNPGDVVLDLGTGTGLLAFMASRAGAAKVYAVEHSDFIEVAREIAAHNGFTNIEFVQMNSREFVPPEPIDVVIHEQMGDELFSENMMENLLDLRDRVLAPGGRILPARFRLFVEPVAMSEEMRIRKFWNIDLPDDIDLSGTEHSPAAARFDTGRNDLFYLRPHSVTSTIGEPEPILEFDLNTLESVERDPDTTRRRAGRSRGHGRRRMRHLVRSGVRRRDHAVDHPARAGHQLGQPRVPPRPGDRPGRHDPPRRAARTARGADHVGRPRRLTAASAGVEVCGRPAPGDAHGHEEEHDLEEAPEQVVDPALADAQTCDHERVHETDTDVQPAVELRRRHQ